MTRIIGRFGDYSGPYVWHCHILEHEENEMMRRMQVVPAGCLAFEPAASSAPRKFSKRSRHLVRKGKRLVCRARPSVKRRRWIRRGR